MEIVINLYFIKYITFTYNIFSVSDPNHNPYFDMVEKKENGFFDLVKNEEDYFSRQKSPKVYDMNASIYVFRRKNFLKL